MLHRKKGIVNQESFAIQQEIFPRNRNLFAGNFGREDEFGMSKVSGQIRNITSMAARVYSCVEQNPDRNVEELLGMLHMSRRSFYEC